MSDGAELEQFDLDFKLLVCRNQSVNVAPSNMMTQECLRVNLVTETKPNPSGGT